MRTADAGTYRMEFDYQWLAGIFVSVAIALGATVRWIVTRMDKMHGADRKWDSDARDKLELSFNDRLLSMHSEFEARFKAQANEVEFLKSELHRYIKHVGVLEGILKSHDIDIPAIEPPALRGLR